MRTAKTTVDQGNDWQSGNQAVSAISNDLNDIEFSIDGFEQPEKTELVFSAESCNHLELSHLQGHTILQHKTLTAQIIAKLQALDNEDVLVTSLPDTNVQSGKIDRRDGDKGMRLLHASEMNDYLDEREKFVFRMVEIHRVSSSPLGFFIRRGDGVFKKCGIFVSRVSEGSIVDAKALLTVGDEIVQVNRVDVEGFSLDDVVRMIQIPKRLVLTVKTNTFVNKCSLSEGDEFDFFTPKDKKLDKQSPKNAKTKARDRANNYKHPGNEDKQTSQTETQNFNVDSNANEASKLAKSLTPAADSTTVEDLIEAIRAENKRSKRNNSRHDQGTPSAAECTRSQGSMNQLIKPNDEASDSAVRNQVSDGIVLPKKPPPMVKRLSSTLTPATSVSLIFDDSEEFTLAVPAPDVSYESTRRKTTDEETLKVHTYTSGSRTPPASPGGSPKARRRLPSVPTDNCRSMRHSREVVSSPPSTKSGLHLPGEPRSRRLLPTPPSSPVAGHKGQSADSVKTAPSSAERQDRKTDRYSRSEPLEDESVDGRSVDLSPTKKESALSISQLFSAFRSHQDGSDKGKTAHESGNDSKMSSTAPQRPSRKSESHSTDIFEQQRHSMFLHSFASGSLHPQSGLKKLVSRSSQPNLHLLTVEEEVLKPKFSTVSCPADDGNHVKRSPKLGRRRASLSSITDKSLANHLTSPCVTDSARLRSEADADFLIFPDDYSGTNLRASHAVSGMVSIHLIKATNLQFADRKLLEKKKKVYCAVEVDFERKAFTASKRASKILAWDEVFEVEVLHGREVCLSCFTSNHEFDTPVAKVSFNLAPFVRSGPQHKVVFHMHPQGAVHVEMEFIEMKTLLKRAPSQRESGVFGFQLNVTSRMENSSVPLIVRKCVEEIDNRGLSTKGLYRISGNARRKKQLHAQFDENSSAVDLSEENYPDVNVIAGILKDYLRELPEPLITQSMSKTLRKASEEHVQDQDLLSQRRLLSKLLVQLPEINRETLVYLLNHFSRVIAQSDKNKMDAHNLSVCFGPVLLCLPANLTDGKDLMDLKLHNRVVEFLFSLWINAGTNS